MSKFKMVDLNEIKLFLGIRFTRTPEYLTLDQSEYIKSVLKKFNMSNCNPCHTPLETNLDFKKLNSKEHYEAPCLNVMGCFIYLMKCTRPDLCFAVNIIGRYIKYHNREVWNNLQRMLKYLQATINVKLTYSKIDTKACDNNYSEKLFGYADANFIDKDIYNDTIPPYSTSGYCFKLYGNLICWKTKRQSEMATSTAMSEYIALFEASKQFSFLKQLGETIGLIFDKPVVMYEDNQAALSIATKALDHEMTKHMQPKYHYSRDLVMNNDIAIIKIITGDQLADAFTKIMPRPRLNELMEKLGLN